MSKIKKMVLGIALAMCFFGGSVSSCYAATSSIEVGVTAASVRGYFRYDEPGHHLKVTVYYSEKDSLGNARIDNVSAHQFGNFISVSVSRPSPEGWQYISGYAEGYVDDNLAAVSALTNA